MTIFLQKSQAASSLGRFTYECALALVLILLPVVSPAQGVQYVSPRPGSTLVSQQTNIILRAGGTLDHAVAGDPSLVVVQGDASGSHTGKLTLSDDEHTLVFLPTEAFTPGENVTVTLRGGVHTPQGADFGPLTFQFRVSPNTTKDQEMMLMQYPEFIGNPGQLNNVARLGKISSDSSNVGYPKSEIIQSDKPSAGSIFLTTFKIGPVGGSFGLVPSKEQFITIVDNLGAPLYYQRMGGLSADFKLQPTGQLTYFDAVAATFYVLDSSYAVVDSFKCGNGYKTDVHELLLLPGGHAVLFGLDPETVNMAAIVPGGRATATVLGMVIQELDRSKNVVFQWRTFDHFKITDATHEDLQAANIDYVHANAIDIDTDGNFIISSRHMDEITKINRTTGDIMWRWGGKNNEFRFVNDSIGFSHQHSIRRTPQGTLILFDDGNFHAPQFSRAVEYVLDEKAKTVTQVWQFRHSPDLYAFAMGSVQRLPDGNTFIGWGMATGAAVTEVRPDGGVAFELRLPDSVVSYRALRFPWNSHNVVTAVQSQKDIPESFALAQNFPNPFNPGTVIQYTIPHQADVVLKVYDVIGREVATLVDEPKAAGTYSVRFDASHCASGVYFYRLSSTGTTITKMMSLLK